MARPSRTRCVLDWLRITIPYKYDENDKIKDYLSNNNNLMTAYRVSENSAQAMIYAVINLLGLDGVNYTNASVATLTKLEHANYGYSETYVIGHARIMYKQPRKYMPLDHIKMGVCLELSSHALRDIEQSDSFKNWMLFFQNVRKYFPDARFSRIDLASDYFKNMHYLSAEGLHRLLKNKKYDVITTSRSNPRYQGSVKNHKDYAETVYFQKPQSSFMIRVYNKYSERLESHGDAWLKKNKIKYWTRWEIQYNAESAPQVAEQIVQGVNPAWIWHDTIVKFMSVQVSDIIVGTNQKHNYVKVDWRNPRSKSSKVREVWVPVWWNEFVSDEHIPKFDISGKSPHYTYDKHMRWIGKCVLPAFTKDLLVEIMQGGNVDTYLNHLLDQGMSKLQPKDIDDLVHYAKQIRQSKFYKTNNQFEFTETINHLSDRLTGMIKQRLYDLRNEAKMNASALDEIRFEEYQNFVHEHGISNNYYNLKGTGVI